MMESVFIQILNMSLTASFVILGVLLLRVFLRRAPKIFSYVLWGVVLFRLLCPVSFSAGFSLLGAIKTPGAENGQVEYIPQDIGYMAEPSVELPISAVEDAVNGSFPAANPAGSINPMQIWLFVGAWVWILGIAILLAASGVSYWMLKRRLGDAKMQESGVYRTSQVDTPFVLGFFRPRIYLPDSLEERERGYILLHERIHIRRRDPLTRAVGFAALCLHWFNPLVWAAYFLSEKDMEMSCDEAVIRETGNSVKKEYTASLLSLSCGRRLLAGLPPAFGEGDTGKRIKNVLKYRSPKRALLIGVVVVCLAAAVFLLANPATRKREGISYYGVITSLQMEGMDMEDLGTAAEEPQAARGDSRLVVEIPHIGTMDIPQAEEIYPFIEMDFEGLAEGDLVKITFPPGEEVGILETYPGMFGCEAESIVVMGQNFELERTEDGTGKYLFSIPAGLAPEAREGDILEISHHDPAIDGQAVEELAAVPILFVDTERMQILIELSPEEVSTFLREFGYGVACSVRAPEGELERQDGGKVSGNEQENGVARPGLAGEEAGNGKHAMDLDEVKELWMLDGETPINGRYRVYARSISRSLRGIDRYVAENEGDGDQPAMVFSGDCVFLANQEMDCLRYEQVTFDTFAELTEGALAWMNPPLILTFSEGLVVEAALESIYYKNGISYNQVPMDIWFEFLEEDLGGDILEKYFTLAGTEEADVADSPGEERIDVYTGNVGDGDSGIVQVTSQEGEALYTASAHDSRAGWNNIYLGEMDGTGFLLLLSIEDRDTYGEYAYYAFRLGEDGEIRQIAGSKFTFGDGMTYDDALFQRWAEKMSSYLENSRLLLSSQEGEIRTERVSEADRYNYETLRR